MSRSLGGLALLASLIALTGCPGRPSAPRPTPRAPTRSSAPTTGTPSGADLFRGTCSACHGPDGKGLPNLGKDLTTSQFFHSQTDDQLLAFVKVGRPVDDPLNTTHVAMPPKGGNPALKDDEIRAIIAYIRTLQTAAAGAAPAATPTPANK